MNRRDEDDKIVQGILAITKMVGSEFGLANFPKEKFRISRRASYWSELNGGVLFYTERHVGGVWKEFAKGTLQELRREVVPLRVKEVQDV